MQNHFTVIKIVFVLLATIIRVLPRIENAIKRVFSAKAILYTTLLRAFSRIFIEMLQKPHFSVIPDSTTKGCLVDTS
jgi:hypothetical protein